MGRRMKKRIVKYLASIAGLCFLLQAVLWTSSCQRISSKVPKTLERVVEDVRKLHAPDSRLELLEIKLQKKGDQIIVSGETTSPKLHDALLDSIRSVAGSADIIDSLCVLPSEELGNDVYGIVRVSVANMRRKPARRTELVSQTLLGTILTLYKEEGGFYYCHNWDRYLGWVSKSSVVRVDSVAAVRWKESPRVICTANYGLVRERSNEKSAIVADLVPGVVLKKLGQKGGWVNVETPDNRVGWVAEELVLDEIAFRHIRPNPERIVSTAEGFLGIPYLWGGTSAKGFDCSGFVQTVYRMNNISLPRDANQIVIEGEHVDIDDPLENLERGDMLFFGPRQDRITHCAVYIGGRRYIHSSTSSSLVGLNSLDPEDPLYYGYLHETLQFVRRIPLD